MPHASDVLKRCVGPMDRVGGEARAALLDMAGGVVSIAKGERVRAAGTPVDEFWCVTEGWFYSSGTLSDGGRQVYAFHLPGDVMGLQDLGWDVAVCDVTAATKASMLCIAMSDFRRLVGTHPVLATAFLAYGVYEHTRLIDRLRVIGRMPAVKRVAHFLLQVADEQARSKAADPDAAARVAPSGEVRLHLPIDQSLIGDAIGLTNISVSRMMSELESRGFVRRSGRDVVLPNPDEMKAFADYKERRRAPHASWTADAAGLEPIPTM